jgi:hypothetical protein
MQLAGILCGIGPTAHARAAVERARRLDPAAADGWVDSYLAEIDGRVEEQIAVLRQQFERRRAAHGSLEQPAMLLAYLNATAGHSSEALSWLATLEGITRNDPLVDLIRLKVMAAMGQKRAVQRLLEGHRAFYERDWQYSLVVAEAFARLGNPEEALWWIQRAVDLGSMDLWGIERIPGLTSLQGDPRLDAATRLVRERVDAVMELVRRAGDA